MRISRTTCKPVQIKPCQIYLSCFNGKSICKSYLEKNSNIQLRMANNYILHFTILNNKCVVLQFDIRGTDYAEMYHDNFCVKTCYVRLTPDVITTGDITHYYRMRGSLIQFKYFGEIIEINYISEDSVPSSAMINNKSLNCKGI